MDPYFFRPEAISELHRAFEQRITQGLKSLLESKHLYQSISLEYKDLLDAILKRVAGDKTDIGPEFQRRIEANWFPIDNADQRHSAPDNGTTLLIRLETPDVKLFCQICERIEAFNSISSKDFLQPAQGPAHFTLSGQRVQVFVFSFLCQSCKLVPEVFLVRRQGLKLTNSCRSPIEHVDVPPVIPKSVRSYYSGAVVAHQSVQTLAGIFLLRTLIEQWTKLASGQTILRADETLEAYMRTLPEDFKTRFPSFPALYDDLSADIHAAKGDAALFDRARDDIVWHFDARHTFRL